MDLDALLNDTQSLITEHRLHTWADRVLPRFLEACRTSLHSAPDQGQNPIQRWLVWLDEEPERALHPRATGEGRALSEWRRYWMRRFLLAARTVQAESSSKSASVSRERIEALGVLLSTEPDSDSEAYGQLPCFGPAFWRELARYFLAPSPLSKARKTYRGVAFPLVRSYSVLIGDRSTSVIHAEFRLEDTPERGGQVFLAPDQVLLRCLDLEFARTFAHASALARQVVKGKSDAKLPGIRVRIHAINPEHERFLDAQLCGNSGSGSLALAICGYWQKEALDGRLTAAFALNEAGEAEANGTLHSVGDIIPKLESCYIHHRSAVIISETQRGEVEGFANQLNLHLKSADTLMKALDYAVKFSKTARHQRKIVITAFLSLLLCLCAMSFWLSIYVPKAHHLAYVNNIVKLQDAWNNNDLDVARQLLESTRVDPEKGFEWHYWDRLLHAQLRTWKSCGSLSAIAFSPNGTQVLTAGSVTEAPVREDDMPREKALLEVWDARTGMKLKSILCENGSIDAMGFSPDGKYFAITMPDNNANETYIEGGVTKFRSYKFWKGTEIWDAVTLKHLRTLKMSLHCPFHFSSVGFSPDSKKIVTGGNIFDVKTGHLERPLNPGHSQESETDYYVEDNSNERINVPVTQAYSPNGKYIIGSSSVGIHVWTARGEFRRSIPFRSGQMLTSTVVPWLGYGEDFSVVCAGTDGSVDIIDLTEEKLQGNQSIPYRLHLPGHRKSVRVIARSPDGNYAATGADDNAIMLWDVRAGGLLRVYKSGHEDVRGLVFSADGTQIVAGYADGTIILWNGNRQHQQPRCYGAKKNSLPFPLIFSHDAEDSKYAGCATRYDDFPLSFGHDGKRIFSGFGWWDTTNPHQRIWHDDTMEFLGPKDLWVVASDPCYFLIYNADFESETSAETDNGVWKETDIRVWNRESRRFLATVSATVPALPLPEISQDQGLIAVQRGKYDITQSKSGRKICDLPSIWCASQGIPIQFFPDSKRILGFLDPGDLSERNSTEWIPQIMDAYTGRTMEKLSSINAAYPEGTAISADSRWIAVAVLRDNRDRHAKYSVLIYSLMRGKLAWEIPLDVKPHIAFSPDSQRLVTGTRDGIAVVWDLETQSKLLTLSGVQAGIVSFSFSPDGRRLAIADEAGGVQIR